MTSPFSPGSWPGATLAAMKVEKTMLALKRWFAILVLAAAAPAFADDEVAYSRAELDQMLAPIALYPDSVLSHVLIASTYPLEIVQAARWSREHPDLHGQEAVDAVEGKPWDASVKALVAFPELLARMDDDLDWTERLGAAFLAQQEEVMDSVQGLRDRAYDAGSLDSLEHARVIREREVIYIEPLYSHVLYVPYYDPWLVYGPWWWPAYRPHCWTHWHGHPARYYGGGFYWGIGFRIAPAFYFTGFHWHDRYVAVRPVHRHAGATWSHSSRDLAHRRDAQRWQHDTRHRHGVAYRSEGPRRDFGHDRRQAIERERNLGTRPSTRTDRGQHRGWSGERRGTDRESPRVERGRADRVRADRPVEGSRSDRARNDAFAQRGWAAPARDVPHRGGETARGPRDRVEAPRATRPESSRREPIREQRPSGREHNAPRESHESRSGGDARAHQRPAPAARDDAGRGRASPGDGAGREPGSRGRGHRRAHDA